MASLIRWEKIGCQFHHDGGFSATAPPPPAVVSMYCEEAPSRSPEMTLRWQPLSTARAAAPSPIQAPARYSASVPLTTAAAAAEGSDQRVHASAHHSGSDPRARRNLRGETFSDFPETNVLGFAEDVTWHGLRGRLEPTAWWEKIGCH